MQLILVKCAACRRPPLHWQPVRCLNLASVLPWALQVPSRRLRPPSSCIPLHHERNHYPAAAFQTAVALAARPPSLKPLPTHLTLAGAIQQAFAFFARRGAAAMVLPEWVPTPDNLGFAGAVARLDRAVYGLIADRRR